MFSPLPLAVAPGFAMKIDIVGVTSRLHTLQQDILAVTDVILCIVNAIFSFRAFITEFLGH